MSKNSVRQTEISVVAVLPVMTSRKDLLFRCDLCPAPIAPEPELHSKCGLYEDLLRLFQQTIFFFLYDVCGDTKKFPYEPTDETLVQRVRKIMLNPTFSNNQIAVSGSWVFVEGDCEGARHDIA